MVQATAAARFRVLFQKGNYKFTEPSFSLFKPINRDNFFTSLKVVVDYKRQISADIDAENKCGK